MIFIVRWTSINYSWLYSQVIVCQTPCAALRQNAVADADFRDSALDKNHAESFLRARNNGCFLPVKESYNLRKWL